MPRGENLKEYQWKKGQSGNPNGRKPKGETLTDALRQSIDPTDIATKLKELADDGDLGALKYIYDRIDGKPVETINQTVKNIPDKVEIEVDAQDTHDTED